MEPSTPVTTLDESFLQRARNGMTARLLCSVLHSGLAFGQMLDTDDIQQKALIESVTALLPSLANVRFWCSVSKEADDIYVPVLMIPLRELPIYDSNKRVRLIDPEEFEFPIFHMQNRAWSQLQSPASIIMNLVLAWHPQYESVRVEQIIRELENCVEHQAYAYSIEGSKNLPRLGDHSMAWEHSLIESHPTHPMHKCRVAVPPMREIELNDDLLHPIIKFVAGKKTDFHTFGSFEQSIEPIRELLINQHNPSEEVIIPVHSHQVSSMLAVFPAARILDYEEKADACLNLRTVQLPSLEGYHLKLSWGIVLTSGARLFGDTFCTLCEALDDIISRVVEDKDLLLVAREVGGITLKHRYQTVVSQLACVFREDPELLSRARGESLVVCAALIERDQNHEFVVNKVLNLNTVDKRWNFLQTYTSLFLKAMLPPLFKYGFFFEAHAQNTLARFKKLEASDTFELVGFVIRDYEGIKFHLETLESTTGIRVKLIRPDHEKSMDLLHVKAFHSFFSVHLFRIVRALGFYYSGEGLELVRNVIDEILPKECVTRELWLNSETILNPAYIKMKLEGKFYEMVFTNIPNILYERDAKIQ